MRQRVAQSLNVRALARCILAQVPAECARASPAIEQTQHGFAHCIERHARAQFALDIDKIGFHRLIRVALLVNATPEETLRIAAFEFVDALQFHGDEDAAYCRWAASLGKPFIKALRARDRSVTEHADSFSTPHVLLDAHVS